MDKGNIAILIVTRSISLSDGLDALLKATSPIDEVQIARSLENVYQQIETRQIQITLIDSNLLGNNPPAALEKIRLLSPKTQRVLLVNDVQEVKLMPRYAEAILIKGASPSAVTAIVTNLLSGKGEDHELNDSN